MQLELITFEYNDKNPFRSIDINGEPWFVAKDVCDVLALDTRNIKKY